MSRLDESVAATSGRTGVGSDPLQGAGLVDAALAMRYDLARGHSLEEQHFYMTSKMTMKAPSGGTVSTTIYRLSLDCKPGKAAEGDHYICRRFTIQHDDGLETTIPSLGGWSYTFRRLPGERDAQGKTLGIDHAPFENLVDAGGAPLSEIDSYHVYNAFIDFHSFQVFSERSSSGAGIQDLHEVGQRIVHAASHSRPATDLGERVASGSWFENGEVTVELTGISRVGERACAIVSVDSGNSSFRMLTKPAPEVELRTEGSSHYWATIYKDLESMWIRRADLKELVVSETVLPGSADPIRGVAERSIEVTTLSRPA